MGEDDETPSLRRATNALFPRGDDEPTATTPLEAIDLQTRRAAADTKQTLNTLQTMRGETKGVANDTKTAVRTVQLMRDELAVSLGKYAAENKLLNARLDFLAEQQTAGHGKIDGLEKVVGTLRESSAAANAKLDLLLGDMNRVKDSAQHRERVATDTAAIVEQAEIEDHLDRRKHRRVVTIKIIAIIGTIVAGIMAIAGAIYGVTK